MNQLLRHSCSHGIQLYKPENGKDRPALTYCDSPFLRTSDPLHPHTCHSCILKVGESHTYHPPTRVRRGHVWAVPSFLLQTLADSLLDKINEK